MLRHPVLPALVLAATTLAGCGVGALNAPLTGKALSASAVGAKAMTPDEIDQMLSAAVAPTHKTTALGVGAVLQYPSDAGQQRALQNLFAGARTRAMPGVSPEVDETIKEGTIARYLKQFPEVSDPEVTTYLQGIADRLTKASGEAPFKVYVADTPVVNAFNAGGHAMVVFTGMLGAVADESELAGIMAHEMTHGLHRHMIKGFVSRDAAQVAVSAAEAQLKPDAADMNLANAFYSTLSAGQQNDYDFVMGFLKGKIAPAAMSQIAFEFNLDFATTADVRANEADADAGGVRMLARAGYDPTGAYRTFDRLNTRADGDTRYYDHPALGSRSAAIKAQIAAEHLTGREKGRDRLRAMVAHLKAGAQAAPVNEAALALPEHVAGAGCWMQSPRHALSFAR